METNVERLAERVQHLEDLEAIRHTWRDYCMQMDSGDLEKLGDVFTEDGVVEMHSAGSPAFAAGFDGVYRGRQSIIGDFFGKVGSRARRAELHDTGHSAAVKTNLQIDLQGDEATTLAYFFEIVANDQVLMGTYQHRLRRDPDRWRFAFLRISVRYRAKLEASEVDGQSPKFDSSTQTWK